MASVPSRVFLKYNAFHVFEAKPRFPSLQGECFARGPGLGQGMVEWAEGAGPQPRSATASWHMPHVARSFQPLCVSGVCLPGQLVKWSVNSVSAQGLWVECVCIQCLSLD